MTTTEDPIDDRATQPLRPPEQPTTNDPGERQARLERLQQRRAGGAVPRRSGSGAGSKVVAAGIGFAGMLGLVAAMGAAGRSAGVTAALPDGPSTAPAEVLVVVHPPDAVSGDSDGSPGDGWRVAASSRPIALNAQPVIRQAPPSESPRGRTNGSR